MSDKFPNRRLGKLPAKHDARTYSMRAMLAKRLPDVPAMEDWSLNVPYQIWGNDTYGDCAFAAHAALVLTWTKAAQGAVPLTTPEVLENYSAVTGFNPNDPNSDRGTILLDMLNHWRRAGLVRPGQTKDYLTAFGAISPKDVTTIKRSICYLGGVLAGVQVPEGFMNLGLGETWDITKISGTDLDPVGGHAIALTGFNPSGVFFSTWGQRTFMPWRTFMAIADESYSLLSRQNWVDVNGSSPKNEDFDDLLSELKAA